MIRESYTAVVARGDRWSGEFATEPHEAAWASEAIFFLRGLEISGDLAGAAARVQISADGLHWADEGSSVMLPKRIGEVRFCRIGHFGGWLRLAGSLPAGAMVQIVASLTLKA
jgi:hypothetical protein